jgi:hypothetical protein
MYVWCLVFADIPYRYQQELGQPVTMLRETDDYTFYTRNHRAQQGGSCKQYRRSRIRVDSVFAFTINGLCDIQAVGETVRKTDMNEACGSGCQYDGARVSG